MRTFFLLLILTSISAVSNFAQSKVFHYDTFSVKLVNTKLNEYDRNNKIIYTRDFNSPQDFAVDLDGDGIDELLVNDSYTDSGKTYYTLYIFNTVDSLYLADSIFSGLIEPYETKSDEAKGTIIVSGNPCIDSLNNDSDNIFLPVNCWKYDNGQLFLINDDLYKIFITENDNIIDYLDNFYLSNKKDCSSTRKIKAAIASGYINYFHSGDKILARQFIREYYLCNDAESFEQNLNKILKEK